MQELRWKIIAIVGVATVFGFLAFTQPIRLGLDLRGGMHLVLRVDVDEAVAAEVRDDADSFRRLLQDEGVNFTQVTSDGVTGSTIVLASAQDGAEARDLAGENFVTYDNRLSGETLTLTLHNEERDAIRDGAIRQALQTIRNRIDEYGVSEPIIQRQGLRGDRILVQLPGVENAERVKALIRNTALLELKAVDSGPFPTRQAAADARGGSLLATQEIIEAEPDPDVGQIGFYIVSRDPIVTGRDLKTARLSQDDLGLPAVAFTLNPDGARKFGTYTGENRGSQLAIVLDDRVYSAPVIEERISDQGQIRGNFGLQEAEDLALVLRSGALPASIEYLEERTVGPSLGRESIDQGVLAAIVGAAIVVAFMLAYYRGAGINAVIALALNFIVVLGVMNALGAALTLPGVAGLILLIGMAVDANVLIFERVREELDVGKTVRSAVDTGFAKAFSAIVDANITTLVAAIFLFQFGTGPVKGFAVTLSIGILASMFTAIFVSRVIFDVGILRRPRTLSI